ncbi:glycosyltransferase family 2 protein [Flavobacterium sp. BFFFF1]|uniref:glycosyltransferase family 2 protein n=1 Tax=Flavobacterium sp. BFFFF1 TaxID=2015557 RepID=UPI0025B9B1A2|nr:glycosyltransferase family 2 protein [Flavobacterium sp. BFFFF1]
MEGPLISIIVPCYNQGDFLDTALQSVADQAYPNWECMIVNDGSTDHTAEIALRWVERDSRFRYTYKKNGGLSSARNCGIDKANGQYIQFLDSDDFIDKEKLLASIQVFKEDFDAEIVVSDFRMFVNRPEKSTIPYCNLKQSLFTYHNVLFQWDNSFSIPIHCGFFKRNLFDGFRFNENLKAKEDWMMWISFFKQGSKAKFLDQPLAFYRRNPNSMTMKESMLEDYLKVYDCLKEDVAPEDFHQFSRNMISKYYSSNIYFKTRLYKTTQSNSYQLGILLKKCFKKLGILTPAKYVFLKIIVFLKK